MNDYKNLYLKYKTKYNNLKNDIKTGGAPWGWFGNWSESYNVKEIKEDSKNRYWLQLPNNPVTRNMLVQQNVKYHFDKAQKFFDLFGALDNYTYYDLQVYVIDKTNKQKYMAISETLYDDEHKFINYENGQKIKFTIDDNNIKNYYFIFEYQYRIFDKELPNQNKINKINKIKKKISKQKNTKSSWSMLKK